MTLTLEKLSKAVQPEEETEFKKYLLQRERALRVELNKVRQLLDKPPLPKDRTRPR